MNTSLRHARRGRTPRLVAATSLMLALHGCTPAGHTVSGSGTIEMDEIDVASQVGGRVVRLMVDEGDSVRAGDTLAVLDQGEVNAGLEARAAESGRAQAQYRDVASGPRAAEIRAAEDELAAATAAAELARSNFTRTQVLADRQVVAAAELDRARADRDQAAARAAAAARQVQLLREGSRVGQVIAARRAAESAAAQLEGARSRARELVLTAPDDAVVLLRNLDRGELAGAGIPVVTLGRPDRLWMRVYVATPDLPRVRLGARAQVAVAGLGGRTFPARVVAIASQAEFTPRVALTDEERANLVFGVKLAIDPSAGVLKAGLPAEARIEPVATAP